MPIEENKDDANLSPAERAKKKMEEIKKAKGTIKSEGEPSVDNINIEQMDIDISNMNSGKPIVGEETIIVPEGEIIDATTSVIEEIDPEKIIPDVATPLSDKTKDRGYTKLTSTATNPLEEEPIIPEPVITAQQINTETMPPIPPVDEGGGSGGGTSTTTPKPPPINPDFGDMSPSEKRKNAEKTADVILANYAQLLPMLPKWLAKYDMGKMEMLDMKQEIRLSMLVTDDGTTIRSYMESENEKADQIFVVTDKMLEEIKPALVDVLMEKGFAMTPMQRLLAGFAGHALTFGVAGFKMWMEHRQAVNVFKEFKEREKAGDVGENNNNGGGNNGGEGTGNDNYNKPNPPNPENPSGNNIVNEQSSTDSKAEEAKAVEITFHDVIHDEQPSIIEVEEVTETKK